MRSPFVSILLYCSLQVSFLKWDRKARLSYALPFHDLKPELALDAFFPLVIALAKDSSARQTRVSASELLHSLLLFAVGRAAQLKGSRSEGGKPATLQLWKHAFPAILHLSCDLDEVRRFFSSSLSLLSPFSLPLLLFLLGRLSAAS